MSGPNTDYDPVQVTPLGTDEVERMRLDALAAIPAADSPEALRGVRSEHAGDRSPLALANREIGALPPQARKGGGQRSGQAAGAGGAVAAGPRGAGGAPPPRARKEAGQRIGQARGVVTQALAARLAVLEAEAEERM